MRTESRSHEYMTGTLSRRRSYKCRICGESFQLYLLRPLPIKDRVCDKCEPKQKGGVSSETEEKNCLVGKIKN